MERARRIQRVTSVSFPNSGTKLSEPTIKKLVEQANSRNSPRKRETPSWSSSCSASRTKRGGKSKPPSLPRPRRTCGCSTRRSQRHQNRPHGQLRPLQRASRGGESRGRRLGGAALVRLPAWLISTSLRARAFPKPSASRQSFDDRLQRTACISADRRIAGGKDRATSSIRARSIATAAPDR